MRLVLAPDSVQAARMSEPLEPREPTRDYWSESPAGDSVYETYARLYDYEPAALDPVVELADTVNGWPMERVSFTGPGSGGRMGVYLFLPEEGRPPYQTILFFNGYAQDSPALDAKHTIMFDYFLRSGRAVAVPILYGTYEPYDPLTGVEQDWFYQSPEIVIRWVRELRRAVDYLEARPDMDARRLAYYGMFIGATHSPIFLATEPRIKVAFTETGALVPLLPSPPPEVDPFQFLPRVRTPIAIMNGRYSGEWPYEASQLPMLDYLGTAPEHRRLVAGVGDPVPFSEVVPIATPWYEEYLGSVEGF
jgi:dienelactone hydrolase